VAAVAGCAAGGRVSGTVLGVVGCTEADGAVTGCAVGVATPLELVEAAVVLSCSTPAPPQAARRRPSPSRAAHATTWGPRCLKRWVVVAGAGCPGGPGDDSLSSPMTVTLCPPACPVFPGPSKPEGPGGTLRVALAHFADNIGSVHLLLASTGGSDAIFYPLVFLHVVAALAGFGSVGFAGTYASRAAQLALTGEPIAGSGAPTEGPGAPGSEQPAPASPAGGPSPAVAPGDAPPRTPEAVGPEARGPEAGRPEAGGPEAGGPDVAVDPEIEELARYFERPARFWKALLAVPVFGVLALWAEPGGGGLDQVWDLSALLVWGIATVVAAGIVVPSLHQVRSVLAQPGTLAPGAAKTTAESQRARMARSGRMANRAAAACDILFFAALALMIWRP
jgi:hypothetical protein